jgi:uncharacterized protein (TIGR03435 family)
MPTFQILGPSWIAVDRFDVEAIFPPATPASDFRLMLQALLRDRFKLQQHLEQSERPVYLLEVAKGGHRLQPPTNSIGEESAAPGTPGSIGRDGFPVLPRGGSMAVVANVARLKGRSKDMAWLAKMLGYQLQCPVIDNTALGGLFDFQLAWVIDPTLGDQAGPDLFLAVREDLGLRLDRMKRSVALMLVDNASRRPAGN